MATPSSSARVGAIERTRHSASGNPDGDETLYSFTVGAIEPEREAAA